MFFLARAAGKILHPSPRKSISDMILKHFRSFEEIYFCRGLLEIFSYVRNNISLTYVRKKITLCHAVLFLGFLQYVWFSNFRRPSAVIKHKFAFCRYRNFKKSYILQKNHTYYIFSKLQYVWIIHAICIKNNTASDVLLGFTAPWSVLSWHDVVN